MTGNPARQMTLPHPRNKHEKCWLATAQHHKGLRIYTSLGSLDVQGFALLVICSVKFSASVVDAKSELLAFPINLGLGSLGATCMSGM
jgi:hypothetical protein